MNCIQYKKKKHFTATGALRSSFVHFCFQIFFHCFHIYWQPDNTYTYSWSWCVFWFPTFKIHTLTKRRCDWLESFRGSDGETVMRADQMRRNCLQAWRQQFLGRRSIFRTCALLGCKTCAQYYLSAGLQAAVSRSSVFLRNRRSQMQECNFRAAILGAFVPCLIQKRSKKAYLKWHKYFWTESCIWVE